MPKSIVPKKGTPMAELPALMTIRGIDASIAAKILNLFDKPPVFHPKKSSTKPTIPKIKTTFKSENI